MPAIPWNNWHDMALNLTNTGMWRKPQSKNTDVWADQNMHNIFTNQVHRLVNTNDADITDVQGMAADTGIAL